MSLDCIHCEKSIAVYCGKCVDAEREELNRLRRLAPTGTYTLNVAHEEEIQRLRSLADSAAYEQGLAQRRMMEAQAARDKAQAKAADYERDWYEAKSEFGSAMAKMREALRAAEKRELEALAELDEARATLQRVVEYDNDPDQSWSDLMSWCRGALLPREEREARCKYPVKS